MWIPIKARRGRRELSTVVRAKTVGLTLVGTSLFLSSLGSCQVARLVVAYGSDSA